jgi:phosphoribosylformylglycinamidine cyclo-ligase
VFGLLAAHGGIATAELERVFNMGVGMVAVVGAHDAGPALSLLASRGVPAWLAGEITEGAGAARLLGQHPA